MPMFLAASYHTGIWQLYLLRKSPFLLTFLQRQFFLTFSLPGFISRAFHYLFLKNLLSPIIFLSFPEGLVQAKEFQVPLLCICFSGPDKHFFKVWQHGTTSTSLDLRSLVRVLDISGRVFQTHVYF